ncbi:MAG TPA: tetratricopeptide repeat protein [Magnetospirillaceae bacterium]|nr:tetratricopeptide repeat protein [Magnetospirillaceae bacterium]
MASRDPSTADKAGRDAKPSLQAALNDFLRKYRLVILTVFAVALTALAAVTVWTLVEEGMNTRSARALEKAELSLREWREMEDGPAARERAAEVLSELRSVAERYRRRYAGQKALVLAGRIQAGLGDWEAAENTFREAADARKDSHLTVFALAEAAVAAEERRDFAAAIELWTRVTASKGLPVGIPHAYFVLGTLYEETQQFEQARASYEKLIAEHPQSDWTKLARSRIIHLKSQGLLP